MNHELLQLIHERVDNDDLEEGNAPMSVSVSVSHKSKNIGVGERNEADHREPSPGAWNSNFSHRADLEGDEEPIIDPALIKLQQYSSKNNINNGNNNNNKRGDVGAKNQSTEKKGFIIEELFPMKQEKNRSISDEVVRVTKERQQSLREEQSRDMQKRKQIMTFHSEDVPEEGSEGERGEGTFHFDNPSLNHAEVEAAATRASSSYLSRVRPPPLDRRKSGFRSGSMSMLSALENDSEKRTFSADDGQEKKALTMVVTHLVKWERTLEFESWIKDLFDQM